MFTFVQQKKAFKCKFSNGIEVDKPVPLKMEKAEMTQFDKIIARVKSINDMKISSIIDSFNNLYEKSKKYQESDLKATDFNKLNSGLEKLFPNKIKKMGK